METWHKRKFAPPPGTFLCKTDDISESQVREIRFGENSPFAFRMFIYNDSGEFKAFRNSCPHYDVPLSYKPEEIFTSDGQYFQCITHYAIFDKSSGLCIEGPCAGEALDQIPLTKEGERLLVGD